MGLGPRATVRPVVRTHPGWPSRARRATAAEGQVSTRLPPQPRAREATCPLYTGIHRFCALDLLTLTRAATPCPRCPGPRVPETPRVNAHRSGEIVLRTQGPRGGCVLLGLSKHGARPQPGNPEPLSGGPREDEFATGRTPGRSGRQPPRSSRLAASAGTRDGPSLRRRRLVRSRPLPGAGTSQAFVVRSRSDPSIDRWIGRSVLGRQRVLSWRRREQLHPRSARRRQCPQTRRRCTQNSRGPGPRTRQPQGQTPSTLQKFISIST